jgi:NAD/NADP transhydrogenase alpha subunit
VAATPETVKKFIALGAQVAVETGAGLSASIADADYAAVGARVGDAASVLAGAQIVLGVQGLTRRRSLAWRRGRGLWRARSFRSAGAGRCLCRRRA